MRRVIGIGCIVLGVVCLLSSVGIVLYNQWEDKNAQESSQALLRSAQLSDPIIPESELEMPTFIVDGYECIGILSIPVLEIELPVFTDWSYEKLRLAPCHYYGSYLSDDLVIAGHNYKSHFGRLRELQEKDLIFFEDAVGNVHEYEVVLVETLPPNATKEMICSGFSLSLYTCTPGGRNRVTVRCKDVV